MILKLVGSNYCQSYSESGAATRAQGDATQPDVDKALESAVALDS
jgi:hypothetical protein